MQPHDDQQHAGQDSTRPRRPTACPRRDGPRAEIWTDRTAAWYRRAAERYAARVLEAIEAFLRERLVRGDGEWVAPFRKRAAAIVWGED